MDAIETYFNNHFPQHDRSSSVIREIKEEIEKIEKIAKAGEKLSKANSSRNKHQENLNTLTGYFNLYIRKGGVSRIDTIDGYSRQVDKLKKIWEETFDKENYTGNYKYNKSKKDGKKFCSDNCFYTHYAETCDNCLEKCVSSYQGKATGYAQTYYQDGVNKTGTLCSKCHQEKLKEAGERANRDK
ncbi:9239_t:CDS:2 [Cetraspora pellucida]|uniref:9239_t:CDS:1 n=1 Tax=Cetraspora pellucida TaxID=1433469 RepID=A0ACA9K2J8_9GLOM|nr:9239_t:CDS:2 [Cetraspora pellucida]